MIIHNITRYQSLDVRSRISKEKPAFNAVSQASPKDTYEPSSNRSPAQVREDLLTTIKKKINSGFYHSKDVLEELSDSFAKALNQTL